MDEKKIVPGLRLQTKIEDMAKYAFLLIVQFPKPDKFSIGEDIRDCIGRMLRLCISAKKKYFKKTTLQDLDVENATLQSYIRVAHEMGIIPHKKYEYISGLLVEIGAMIGAWIKSNNATLKK
ncbi:MAG: hypothetical protein EUB_03420 [Eubacterium sp.]|uniref:diversity-generating retroelement protein Avd n=1 Tax=Eubacterium sp. TaxID=142586 RepID=UPI0030411C02